ncbi:MAG: hypothetical protein Roseis2KO_13940 [Roseivirga sp.]
MIENHQTEQIRQYLQSEKLTDRELIDDLTDHISCEIERAMAAESITFEDAFELAKRKILPAEPFQVQHDTQVLTLKRPNIMIKKIAFTGGYASTICLLAAITLFALSAMGERKIDLAKYSIQIEVNKNIMAGSEGGIMSQPFHGYENYDAFWIGEMAKAYDQLMMSQIFLVAAILLFALTYLPYQFYSRFQKHLAEPQFG